MPIYEYRCEDGHHFDVMQKMTDGPVTECEVCGKPVQRVFHPVAVHFKGSGFYNTDYGTARRKRETDTSAKSGADSHDAKRSESKSETRRAPARIRARRRRTRPRPRRLLRSKSSDA